MPVPDDDRRALAARLAPSVPAAADVVADAVDADAGEELREVLVDVDGEVVAFTNRRVLFVGVGDGAGRTQPFPYAAIEVRRREEGLGVDAAVTGDRLVLDVARSTHVRLGVVVEGNPPARATWLPAHRPPQPPPVPTALPTGPPVPPDRSPAPPSPTLPQAAPALPQSAPALPQSAPALPPPGWHPDPSGRHWWRWWDGRGWTDHVADGGAPYLDPLPPR